MARRGAGDRPATGSVTAKRFLLGTHRTVPPEETWARVRTLLPALGVTRVADVTGLDRLGIPVYQAVRPASRNISVSQGKGATPEAARVSAVMEALETWHAESIAHLPQVVLSLREMRYANPITESQLPWIPGTRRLEAMPLAWVEAEDLGGGPPAWLPRRLLELDFSEPPGLSPQMFHRTSNGLASGNCREEALVHSLCELIERHALYLARLDPRRRRPVDPGTIPEDHCRSLLERIVREGGSALVYDVTPELGVPVIAVDVSLPDLPQVWPGSGCHPAPGVALSRALTEAAQSRLTYISGARDDIVESLPDDPPAEALAPPLEFRPFSALPDLASGDVALDLRRVLARLDRAGHRAYAVDLTRAELGVPVTRAFVPGFGEALHA